MEKCTGYNIFNLDTGECLHEDFPIPIGQTFSFKEKRFTGNGNTVFNFLLLNGINIMTIESLKYYSYNLEEYIQEYKEKYQELSVELPKIVMLKNITIPHILSIGLTCHILKKLNIEYYIDFIEVI